jgi:hypothetical protein
MKSRGTARCKGPAGNPAQDHYAQPTLEKPWLSWGGTARFVIIRVTDALPTLVLLLAYLHR